MDVIESTPRLKTTNAASEPYEPSCRLYVSGLVKHNTQAVFEITGDYGGLAFTKRIACTVDRYREETLSGDAIFALHKSEHLYQEDYRNSQDRVRKLGMDYHVATRQTSLLALEPGSLEPARDREAGQDHPDGETKRRSSALAVSSWVPGFLTVSVHCWRHG